MPILGKKNTKGSTQPQSGFADGMTGGGSGLGGAASVQKRLSSLSRMATIAIVVAAISVGAAVVTWALSTAQTNAMKENTRTIVCAATEINAGTPIDAGMLKTVDVPGAYISEGASDKITDFVPESGAQLVATHHISPNEQMTKDSVSQSYKLSAQLDPGTYAVTIPVGGTATLCGMLKPGDTVDLYNGTQLVAPDMEILALDSTLTEAGSELTSQYSNITFQVTKAQGRELLDLSQNGAINIMLHSSKSASAAAAATATAAAVQQ